jgi:hypothetical protein
VPTRAVPIPPPTGAAPTPPPTGPPPTSPQPSVKKNWFRRHPILTFILALLLIGVIASAASNKNGSSPSAASANDTNSKPSNNSSSTPAGGSSQRSNSHPSNHATDSYTPHVGPHGSVFVDTQTWRVLGVGTTKRIGGQYTGSAADGRYLILRLSVENGKSQSVTITDDMVKLEANGDEYSVDNDGTTALELSGGKTFLLKDLGPGVTTTGVVAFDVPSRVLTEPSEACFHELGLGSSKGCIRLR